jgi:hypothetical protein
MRVFSVIGKGRYYLMRKQFTMTITQILFLCALIVVVSSCRKYRIEHFGCKEDAFYEEGLFMPNFFTPNGDGNNDYLMFIHDSVPVSLEFDTSALLQSFKLNTGAGSENFSEKM